MTRVSQTRFTLLAYCKQATVSIQPCEAVQFKAVDPGLKDPEPRDLDVSR